MRSSDKTMFHEEVARLMPQLLRAVTVRGENILTGGDLALSHIVVVDILSEKGECTMGEIAAALNFTMSAATAIVDKMVQKRLVKRERDIKDRRVVKVSLVSGGIKVAKKVHAFRRDITKDLFSCLSSRERDEYLRILRKVYANISRNKK